MNKELQKLLKQINDKKNEVKSLVNDGKLDKARAAKEELVELQNRFDLLYDLDEDEQDGIENKVKDGTAKQVGGDVKPDKKNIVKSFVNIVKAGFLHKEADEADIKVYKDALTSDTTAGSEGEVGIGVTIPEDIRTDIIELRRSSDNLEQYVNVEGVTTKTGTRNIEVDAEYHWHASQYFSAYLPSLPHEYQKNVRCRHVPVCAEKSLYYLSPSQIHCNS